MNPLIEIQELTMTYSNSGRLFSDLSLSIYEGNTLAVRGDNGSGKSTFLKILAGITEPAYGLVKRMKSDMLIGYVPEKFPYNIRFTSEQYLYHMGRIQGMSKKELQNRVPDLLRQFDMGDQQTNAIYTFSKGMKQKIGIMQALLVKPDILLLDEPFSGLDLDTQHDLESILYRLKTNGLTIIFTSHDKKRLDGIVDRVITLGNRQDRSDYTSPEEYPFHAIIEVDMKGQPPELLDEMNGMISRKQIDEVGIIRLEVHPSVSDQSLLTLIQHGISIQSLYKENNE